MLNPTHDADNSTLIIEIGINFRMDAFLIFDIIISPQTALNSKPVSTVRCDAVTSPSIPYFVWKL